MTMAESLTRDQFRIALADAVTGVLNVYREVDALLRELGAALGDGTPRFVPLVGRLVPGVGRKNPDARYLREYVAAVYAPIDAMEENEAEEEDEEDEEENEGDEEEGETARPAKQPLTIKAGSGILIARATIYDRASPGFEPNLIVAALTRCRIDVEVSPGTPLKVSRWRFKRILRALERHRWAAGKPLDTKVPAQIVGGPKSKHKLIFDLPSPLKPQPLFEVTPAKLREIAESACKEWSAISIG